MHLPSICCYTFLRKKRKFFSLASNVNSVTFRCCSTLLFFALFLFDYLYVVNISSALCKHILHAHTHTLGHIHSLVVVFVLLLYALLFRAVFLMGWQELVTSSSLCNANAEQSSAERGGQWEEGRRAVQGNKKSIAFNLSGRK